MKTPRIAYAVGQIDGDLVAAAGREKGQRHGIWIKWGAAAACLAVLVMAGAALLPGLLGGAEAGRCNLQFVPSEVAIEWPWAYETTAERYGTIRFDGRSYSIKSGDPLDPALLGEALSACEALGQDPLTGEARTAALELRQINGVSETVLVAAGMEGEFYVYSSDDPTAPGTFGELLDLYGLPEALPLSRFSVCRGYSEKEHYALEDGAPIWQLLSACRDAALCNTGDTFDLGSRGYLSFTATSEALGVYKRVVCVTEDGYFSTNILDYSRVYFIGEAAAGEIIRWAEDHAAPAEPEPYILTVAGTVTEVGDGYVLIDDTVLCRDPGDGTVYKVYTGDLRVRRCVEYLHIAVDDVVLVEYRGPVSAANEITDARSIVRGTLVDGDLAVPE